MLFNLVLIRHPRLRQRMWGTLRVLGYGLCVSLGLGALTARQAVADIRVKSLEVGRKLGALKDLGVGAHEFRLNGQSVFFASNSVPGDVHSVLDRVEAQCESGHAVTVPDWISHPKQDTQGKLLPNRFGVVRAEDAHVGDGTVLCFSRDTAPVNFLDAMRTFVSTSDLHSFGNVRYVHALQSDNGMTTVKTIWTDGAFVINQLVGEPGKDSVGSDSASLPRPINSVRTLTAEGIGTPFSARIYESKSSPQDVLDAFQTSMASSGWLPIHLPAPSGRGQYFYRVETGEQAYISVSKDEGQPTRAVIGGAGKIERVPVGQAGAE